MRGNVSKLRNSRKVGSRQPVRNRLRLRPALELLETRLAPANVPVLSGHYDAFLSGANVQETLLTPANVNPANFGRLFNYPVDGYTYAQPLYVPNLTVAGGTHNVVFAATEHDSVYAFDADGAGQLWKRSFINPGAGVSSVPQPDVISPDVVPEIGITGTPVIDATNTMYVLVKTKEIVGGTAHYVQRLHALDITTGLDRSTNGVVTVGDTTIGGPDEGYTDNTAVVVAGTGIGSDGTNVRFNALREHQRPALTLVNGIVYIAWASHGDNGPYHGWVVGYQASNLSLQKIFNTSPNGNASGIWESGGGLGVDSQNNLYFATGNGFPHGSSFGFNPAIGSFSESVLKLSTTGQLSVADYFTPTDWQTLDQFDADLGSGGTMLLPDAVGSAAHPHLIVETGKTGRMYLMDRDNLGRNNTPGPDLNLQTVSLGGPGVWGNPAFFLDQPGNGQPGTGSGLIYYWGTSVPMEAFRITNGVVNPTPVSQTTFAIGFPGAQPSISANGTTSGIAWALRVDNFGQKGPAELMAFDALDLTKQLYDSNTTGQRDQFGSSVKFIYPIVSNSHVYSGSNGFLSVFGLFPTPAAAPAAPSNAAASALSDTQVRVSWISHATASSPATGYKIFRSAVGATGPFMQVNTVARDATTYTDTGLTASTQYWYDVVGTNQRGDSAPSNVAVVRTRLARPVLQVADVCVGSISLSWSGTANNHYDVKRSTDGITFTPVATVPATQTTFVDSGLANGTYFYQVTANSTFPEGPDTGDSNIARALIGPININHFVSPGNPGFSDSSDMQANGTAQFTTENLLRLNNNFSQAGSAFTLQRVGVRGFTTSFQIRLHEGTQPNPADGLAFVLQANNSSALGNGGGALGFQGILNSVAIKFDVFDNEGETADSTGIFFNGGFPGLPHNPGEVNVALDPNNVNLRSQSVKTITLTYSGTALIETIHDPTPGQTNNGDFSTTYTVDIASRIGADTAYAGFTGGTGGLFSLQDVLNWRYNEQEANLPPRAPTNLLATVIRRQHDDHDDFDDDNGRADVALAWKCNNAYTAQGFRVERSSDGVNFTPVGSVSATTTTFTDLRVPAGAFYYRVRSFNVQGPSSPSNVTTIENHVPAAPVNLHTLNIFTQHVEISWDPNSSNQSGFRVERSTDGVNFTPIARVGPFTTSFIDQRSTTPVYYRVKALSADDVPGLPSNVLLLNSVGQFVSQDIGNVGFASTATFAPSTGTYAVNASGSDIWDVADSFNYSYRPLAGDGEIVARVVRVENTDFWAKAGVMIRESPAANSRDVFMLETPDVGFAGLHNEPVFQWRTDTGGFTSDSGNHINLIRPAPIWVRLTRTGNNFDGFWASDISNGQSHGNWMHLGPTVTVNMGVNVFAGLAVTAHNNGAINHALFDHVTITQVNPTALGAPSGLIVAHLAPQDESKTSITISWHPGSDTESGFKIERSTDGIHFTPVGTTRAGATTFTDNNSQDREEDDDGRGLSPGTYYYRVKAFATGLPDSAYSNVDSVRFAEPGQRLTIDHSGGFANHRDLTTNGSTTIFPTPAPVGTFLGHQDLGGVAATGAATFAGGTYTVQSSGADIWDVADSMQYVYKPLQGDGEIVARAVSIGPTDFWAKGGLMIREALRANSRNAFILETPNLDGFCHNEPVFQWRTDSGGFTADSGNHVCNLQAPPIWLRLVRQGNNFSGFWAQDLGGGQHGAWQQLGPTVPINMATTVYVGLGLTAHNNDGRINTSTFDNVTITGTTVPLPPSVLEITDGRFGEAGGAFLNNRVGVQNFTTTFTFQITGNEPTADGMAFVIQGIGPTALGPAGGGLGYASDTLGVGGGLPRSMAIKFDLFDNAGEGINSTGIFTDGRSPTLRHPGLAPGFPDTSISLVGTGIDLHSGHAFSVNLAYDGTTLTQTITDTVTSATFTTTYLVNISGLLGSDVGYMGFTGGTGGLTAVQDIRSWTIRTTIPRGDDSGPSAPSAGGDSSAAIGSGPVMEPGVLSTALNTRGDFNSSLGNGLVQETGAGRPTEVQQAALAGAVDRLFSSPDLSKTLNTDAQAIGLGRHHQQDAGSDALDEVFSRPDPLVKT